MLDACRKLGITEHTYYRWKKEYGGLRVDQAKRLKALEQENLRLKRIVANQALDLSNRLFVSFPESVGERSGGGGGRVSLPSGSSIGQTSGIDFSNGGGASCVARSRRHRLPDASFIGYFARFL